MPTPDRCARICSCSAQRGRFGTGLSDQTDPRGRAVLGRQRHRHRRAHRDGAGVAAARPADHRREPGRRRRHASASARSPRRIPTATRCCPVDLVRGGRDHLFQPRLRRAQGLRRHHRAGQPAERAGGAAEQVQDAEGPGRRREGQSRQDELRLGRRGQRARISTASASAWRPAPRCSTSPTRAGRRALAAVMSGDCDFYFIPLPAARGLVAGGKLAILAVSGSAALGAASGRPDHGRGGLSELRIRLLGRLLGAEGHAAGDRRQAQRRNRQGAAESGGQGQARQHAAAIRCR